MANQAACHAKLLPLEYPRPRKSAKTLSVTSASRWPG